MAVLLERAVEAPEIVTALRHHGMTQQDIATATSVSARTIGTWEHQPETGIRDGSYNRLQEVRDIGVLLRDSLTRKGVGQWFRARNRLLSSERPIDVLKRGDVEAVRRAAHAFIDGAYV